MVLQVLVNKKPINFPDHSVSSCFLCFLRSCLQLASKSLHSWYNHNSRNTHLHCWSLATAEHGEPLGNKGDQRHHPRAIPDILAWNQENMKTLDISMSWKCWKDFKLSKIPCYGKKNKCSKCQISILPVWKSPWTRTDPKRKELLKDVLIKSWMFIRQYISATNSFVHFWVEGM